MNACSPGPRRAAAVVAVSRPALGRPGRDATRRKETLRRRRSVVPISPMIAARHPSSLDAAISWIVDSAACLAAETESLRSACHRILAREIRAVHPIPMTDRAALDGFAVTASATIGAGSYNPLSLVLRATSAGEPIPPGTDAVIPLNLAQTRSPTVV